MLIFRVLLSLNINVYKGHSHLLNFRGRLLHGVVCCRLKVLLFFFVEIFKQFFRGTHVLERSLIFCSLLFVMMGFQFAPARGSPTSVTDFVMTSQDYIKVEHVRT